MGRGLKRTRTGLINNAGQDGKSQRTFGPLDVPLIESTELATEAGHMLCQQLPLQAVRHRCQMQTTFCSIDCQHRFHDNLSTEVEVNQ